MRRIVQQELRIPRAIESTVMAAASDFTAKLRMDRVLVYATSIAHFAGHSEDELEELAVIIRTSAASSALWISEILPVAFALADRQAVEIPEHLRGPVSEAKRLIHPVQLNPDQS